ncbi:murein tripeptide amidase MpaA [Microbulbifer thermotolerans]|uniref:Murein peptide amidase A n=1 Tax=Microbulbifer thermotolerans TaxID=252514 RepID=A0A143HL97_MICTH|nr:murein tripeptide amidase MpaA [Microbulbifer thermotolerans]AMX02266.1 murein peptide amidase A [Microbulbifer thermotolerans]
MSALRPRSDRGHFCHPHTQYGATELGAPLFYFPAQSGDKHGIVMAGTHGDEVAAVVALSCALRALPPSALRHHVILAVNPDGCQLGLRANARGVDLNRNFATANWDGSGTTYRWNSEAEARDVRLSTGSKPGSEKETRALCRLIAELQPAWAVSIHEPLACVEAPDDSTLGQWLAGQLQLPLVNDIGYQTPGSFGTWCAERSLPCITVELPPVSADAASETYLQALIQLLTYEQ